MKKYFYGAVILSLIFFGIYVAHATSVFLPVQGGTGIGTATTSQINYVLTVSSSNPFVYKLAPGSGGGGATTTIAAGGTATGPVFAFATSGPLMSVNCTVATCTFTTSATSSLGLALINAYSTTTITGSTYLNASAATGNVTLTNLGVQTLTASSSGGLAVSTATGTPVVSLVMGGNAVQNCSAGQFAKSLTATGTVTCGLPSLTATSTVNGLTSGVYQIAVASDTNIGLAIATSTGPDTITLTTSFNGNLSVARGGSATTTFAAGLIYASGTNAFKALATSSLGLVPASRNINTTSPITGGGNLGSDLTIACATCQLQASSTINSLIGPWTFATSGVLETIGFSGNTVTFTSPATSSLGFAQIGSYSTTTITAGSNITVTNGGVGATTVAVTSTPAFTNVTASGYVSSTNVNAGNTTTTVLSVTGTTTISTNLTVGTTTPTSTAFWVTNSAGTSGAYIDTSNSTPSSYFVINNSSTVPLFETNSNSVSYVIGGAQTTSNALAAIGGTIAWSATSTGNTANVTTTLMTYTVPTSTLQRAGDELDIYAGGTVANTASNKDIQLIASSTIVFDTGGAVLPVNAAYNWFLESRCIYVTASSTLCATQFTDSGTSALTDDSGDAGNKLAAVTSTRAYPISIGAFGTNASDVVANYFRILYTPAP